MFCKARGIRFACFTVWRRPNRKVNSSRLFQALKHLRSVQVINFGDCLLRSAGASAIADSVSGGLPILKVTSWCARTPHGKTVVGTDSPRKLRCRRTSSAINNPLTCLTGTQPVLWRDHRGSRSYRSKGRQGQGPVGETWPKRYKPVNSSPHVVNLLMSSSLVKMLKNYFCQKHKNSVPFFQAIVSERMAAKLSRTVWKTWTWVVLLVRSGNCVIVRSGSGNFVYPCIHSSVAWQFVRTQNQ